MTSAADLPAAESNFPLDRDAKHQVSLNPLQTATGVYVTVHGHFYQPPRENPYLDAIERQPSAAPAHDWNERIHHECYRPNAFARVLNDRGEVLGIVNNYEYFSFNFGSTLLSWLERYDLEVYQRIIEADRNSCARLNGHGNAIAQVYNHIILPLANERDKYTQIRWGIEDFRSRFGHDPEGMWLAETAVDYPTLEALVAEGIRFIILAPSQAQRCRTIPTDEQPVTQWHEVGGSQIDPTRPYRCFLEGVRSEERGARGQGSRGAEEQRSRGEKQPDSRLPLPDSRPYIDIFFYDGPISRDMGFSDALSNSHHFIGRMGLAIRGDRRPAQLISVATDGETFGHHKGGTEKTFAYAFTEEFPRRGWTVTNYAHYLSLDPPTWEVELKPVTAWSCSHGVDRWQDDCGCGGGGEWHQKWRRPLRNALDWLRDRLIDVYETAAKSLFCDPWLARDEYIQVIRDRSVANVQRFLSRHQSHSLTDSERVDALRLLEMQRHALLMYTSCGWFFEEISRPEGTQILRYAARALELAEDVAGVQLEKEFINRLSLAPSNVEFFGHGAEVYRQLVLTAQVNFQQIAAQYAITSLFRKQEIGSNGQRSTVNSQLDRFSTTHCPLPTPHIYCYTVNQLDYQWQRVGTLTLAVGQLELTSEITWEKEELVFAVLHLGGWDFHCCIQPFTGRRSYNQMKEQVFESLQQASAAHTIQKMIQIFGDRSFNLQDLIAEERHRIVQMLSQESLTRLDLLYTQVYRDNYGVLMAYHRDYLPVPQELQVAAEIALGSRCLDLVRSLCEEIGDRDTWEHWAELEAVATEANLLRCQLKLPEVKQSLEQLMLRSLWQLLHGNVAVEDIQKIERAIDLGYQLNLGLSLARVQEVYCRCLHSQIIPQCLQTLDGDTESRNGDRLWDLTQLRYLLRLGQKLSVDVGGWLDRIG
jgi:alpha-amylase/alpha-mannosidase (GH57 family)